MVHSDTARYAQVAVNAPGAGRRSFTYAIPDELAGRVTPGHAVIVPFGRHTFQGIVLQLTQEPLYPRARPIESLASDFPVIAAPLLGLGEWIAERYHSDLYTAYRPMLPPAFERRHTIVVRVTPAGHEARDSVSARRADILDFVLEAGETTTDAIRDEFGARAARDVTAMTGRGYLETSDVWEGPRLSPRMEPYVQAAIPRDALVDRAREIRASGAFRQADALEAVADNPGASLSDLRQISGALRPSWDALAQAGLIVIEQRETRRDPLASRHAPAPEPVFQLTPHQRDAVNQISASMDSAARDVFLLYGVTGSGKTEVYLQAFQKVVEMGKRGIMLVPEIALTPQTIGRFWERFPGRVAVLHSGLTLRERYDEWRSIAEGQFDIVIGSRSAALAPIPDVGLIVLDEEQEWTYKQDAPAPRYHARDVAIERARREGAVVLLGSATPDVVTMYAALRNQITLLELPGRITTTQDGDGAQGWTERPLADVEIVDLRRELMEGNRSIFSRVLRQEITDALERGEQAILFVNRRGAGQAVQCRACGHTMRCRRCATAMTYHADESIVCHVCGAGRRSPTRCPRCRRTTIRAIGIGTERVAADAEAAFPGARVIRWDSDAVRAAQGHEAILGEFIDRRADILVGTQMIAKGLDLPGVTVVGVVNADIGLNAPDFRASERIFQLLCQVAGRAGRGHAPGRVIVQTYEPEHEAVQAAAAQDYRQFYMVETQFRRQRGYPPYTRVARLTCARLSQRDARLASEQLARALRGELRARGIMGVRVIGPAPAPMQRLRGRYRWQITIIGDEPLDLLNLIALPPGWTVDVDPMSSG